MSPKGPRPEDDLGSGLDAALEVVDVSKVYGAGLESETVAVRDVSFRVEKGAFCAIVGPSGSGKSTLLNLIGALDRPTSGKIFLDGIDIAKLSSADLARIRNKKLGFVFQSFNLIGRMSAVENVETPLLVSDVSKAERRERAMKLLSEFGIAGKADHRPNQLSGGEQQRVAVARALCNDPSMILADEPTGNLDSRNRDEVMRIFREINGRGRTIVMITHDMAVAKNASSVVSMLDGKVVAIAGKGN